MRWARFLGRARAMAVRFVHVVATVNGLVAATAVPRGSQSLPAWRAGSGWHHLTGVPLGEIPCAGPPPGGGAWGTWG